LPENPFKKTDSPAVILPLNRAPLPVFVDFSVFLGFLKSQKHFEEDRPL